MIIGIDLGTTNSVAAYMSKDGPQLIPNALGEVLTPSVIGIEPSGALLVGAAAKELRVIHPERCASVFKRYMGTEWSIDLAGRNFTPEQLSSLVLRSLKQDAEAHLGRPVSEAVITVPAYFNELQRKATLMAGRMAGFDVRRILNEPTAAALAYGVHESGANKVYVVVDLGGGTFDVSVVDLFEGALEVRASSGESFLGGEDFSRTLAARVLERAGYVFERAELEQPKLVSRMLQLCEAAKCQLSRQATATVRVADREGNLAEDSPTVTFTREQFEGWSQHILTRIEMPIRRAMGDAKLKPADLDEVILVGGATRMPMVIDRLTRLLGRTPQCRLNPDEVVALGAAVQAGLIASDQNLEDMVVTDVAPFTLGIEITKRIGLELRKGHFLPIIHRNTTIPVSRVERVETVSANQTEIRVKVYQGESRRVEGNLLLGEFLVRNIPRGPPGQDVDVRFTYDLNGVLQIEAVVVETKQKMSHLITRYAHGLNEQQIAAAVEAMESLKTHPRDEASNRFLLRRAERLYQELPMLERGMLAELLDGFEAALDLSDKEAVERFRESLQEMLDRFEIADDDSYGPSDE